MRNTDYFRNKNVTVVGLARSGLSCANLLYSIGAKVSVTDIQDNAVTRLNAAKLKSKEIKFELGRHSPDFIQGRDLIVVSPGVNNTSEPVLLAQRLKIPIISEIEVGWILCPATIIAITGSNGKTTVTTLIAKVLEAAKRNVFVCGNIGNPFCAELDKMKETDFVSLEVSSFQLERIQGFKAKVAVILNFSRNHLDRHKDMQEYLNAKKRIFMNQDRNDYLILNEDDPIVRELAKEANSVVAYFKKTESLNPNQAAVLAVSRILGIDEGLSLKVLREFKGIPHRMEYVGEIENVKFINDSKATTAEATAWALENISGRAILIAGGKDKGIDYGVIAHLARNKVKNLILIGEAAGRIASTLGSVIEFDKVDTLEEAVNLAFKKAQRGDCVLLSPMCSSFDMFKDYEDRGDIFKKIVYDLAKKRNIDI